MRLVADNLEAERGGEPVFSQLSFTLEKGAALVVSGPNGSGKSTLLRVVAGLLPASTGGVRLEGGGDTWPDASSAAHYLGHLNAMKPSLTVSENLGFWRGFLGEDQMSIDQAMDAVGLATISHLPFAYLSTGQKRRAAIARLLVSHRPLWLLDEPTAGLDKASEGRLAEIMRTHLSQGGMIMAATHLPLGLEGAHELAMGAKR